MSKLLLQGLIIFYIVLMVSCIFEKRWPMVTYWLGATLLNIAVLQISYFGGK